jgi:hypothetical protein
MTETNNCMDEKKSFSGNYEFKIFCSLPSELREKIIDLNGNIVSLNDINPFSLVCVQISSNPGVRPFIISNGNTTFDLFKKLAIERGISIEKLREALAQKYA